jgi:hypothetical protein
MTEKDSAVAYAIWQAQAANRIGRDNAAKRAQRAGMITAARHIASALYPASARQAERLAFLKACGFEGESV